jgi:hypothetical protein
MKNAYKKNIILKLIVFTVFLLLGNMPVFAATYYVATNGTDSLLCGSNTSECATIQYVLNNKVNAGDTIKVKSGTYNLGSNTISVNNPSRHANLTLTADDPNNRPLLRFSSSTSINIRVGYYDSGNPGNDISVSGVTISYLKVESGTSKKTSWGTSVRVDRESNPVTIDNCEIYNGYVGIAINTGKKVTVSNNKIYAMGIPSPPYTANGEGMGIGIYNFGGRNNIASGWNEKIYIYNNEAYDLGEDGVQNVNTNYRYIEIAYNNFHDNYEDGVDLKDVQYMRVHHNKFHHNQNKGFGNASYSANDLEIWANEIYSNKGFGIIAKSGFGNRWKMYNNLIYNNCTDPPSYGCDGVSLSGSGHEFYNNVVYANTIPSNATYAGAANAGFSGTATLRNNIFFNNATGKNGNIINGSGGTIDNNYVYPASPGITGNNAITVSNPQLKAPENADFRLLSNSPLIDAGDNVGVTTDYAGKSRPKGGGYDIGAYEYDTAPDSPKDLFRKTN